MGAGRHGNNPCKDRQSPLLSVGTVLGNANAGAVDHHDVTRITLEHGIKKLIPETRH